MALVAGLDLGGGAVKACLVELHTGEPVAVAERPTPASRPAPGRVEFDPDAWWTAAGEAMREAVERSDRPAADVVAVSAASLRQGYVLLDDHAELGLGVLNADTRGAPHLARLRDAIGSERLYDLTGHWPAPQLTLPKLLDEQRSGERWDRARTVLFVHDWALWRMCGVRRSEPSLASAGQMLDVRRRTWAVDVLDELGIGRDRLPTLAEAGTVVGTLHDRSLGLPQGIDVVVGGADTQLAAAGAGGLEDRVVCVVAGTTTPIQVSLGTVPRDPERHPWVSAHVVSGRWAVETNAGYAGMHLDWLARISGRTVAQLADEAGHSSPGAGGMSALVAARTWSEPTWSTPSPTLLAGFEPRHGRGDVARAFIEGHAYGIRGNLEDLERAIGAPAGRICLLGAAGRSPAFAQLVADVIGRALVRSDVVHPAGRAFAWLARRASTADVPPPDLTGASVDPVVDRRYEEAYDRYVRVDTSVRRALAGWAA